MKASIDKFKIADKDEKVQNEVLSVFVVQQKSTKVGWEV